MLYIFFINLIKLVARKSKITINKGQREVVHSTVQYSYTRGWRLNWLHEMAENAWNKGAGGLCHACSLQSWACVHAMLTQRQVKNSRNGDCLLLDGPGVPPCMAFWGRPHAQVLLGGSSTVAKGHVPAGQDNILVPMIAQYIKKVSYPTGREYTDM